MGIAPMNSITGFAPVIVPMALLGPVPSTLSIYSLLRNDTRRGVMATLPTVAIATIGLTATDFTVRLATKLAVWYA